MRAETRPEALQIYWGKRTYLRVGTLSSEPSGTGIGFPGTRWPVIETPSRSRSSLDGEPATTADSSLVFSVQISDHSRLLLGFSIVGGNQLATRDQHCIVREIAPKMERESVCGTNQVLGATWH